AYTIKLEGKARGHDFVVPKLEGLWWALGSADPGEWRWKLLLRVPGFVSHRDLSDAVRALEERGKGSDAAEVQLEDLDEGLCVQALHIGPYNRENETIDRMTAVAHENHLEFVGVHHEIYLSDPNRTPPERLRTILRHPVR
ncbi:MAG TPA: GyrI-like domain-containing protein, partial [Chloroflexota bacterium]|nr:GyrI-like domain-containing protein [Chloroflexota bacterium]